jgi:hypothetical protein
MEMVLGSGLREGLRMNPYLKGIRDHFFSPEQRRVVGHEARQLLENGHFRDAFESVESSLIEVAKSCDPDNKEKAARVVISMQLLEAVKREIIRKVEDGDMAEFEMNELERGKKLRVFQR